MEKDLRQAPSPLLFQKKNPVHLISITHNKVTGDSGQEKIPFT
jgi:hypothetical protein